MKNISPPYKFSLKGIKGGGWDEQRQPKTQPSAEIVRVECAKRRRECDLSVARATLCGDRARRVREMQARVRFAPCARKPLECAKCRRECDLSHARANLSSARNAGESAICPMRAQPSAEIVRVECAKCRRECDLPHARATLCGDRACRVREMQARVRFVPCARNTRAEIVRFQCAKCRRECDLPHARATSAEIVRVERAKSGREGD